MGADWTDPVVWVWQGVGGSQPASGSKPASAAREGIMKRDDLFSLCGRFASRRQQMVFGRVTVDFVDGGVDPVPEIIRSFREAEISESEKNSLLSLVSDDDENDFCDEEVCVTDPYADELAAASDDDEIG